MTIKEQIVETVERIYYLNQNNKYTVKLDLFSTNKLHVVLKKNAENKRKWRAKNH